MKVLEKRLLRICEANNKRDEVRGSCQKLRNVRIRNLQSSPVHNIRTVKALRMRQTELMKQIRYKHKILAGKPEPPTLKSLQFHDVLSAVPKYT